MKSYAAYIFDWDGTLARTVEVWLEEIKRGLEARGMPVDDAENARNLGNPDWPLAHGFPKDALDKANEAIERAALARLPSVGLYDGALEVLASLKANGKKIGLVSSSWRESLDAVMSRQDIEGYFDVIVSGERVTHAKPDPEGLLLALNKLDVSPEDAVVIGDNYKDLAMATAAHVDSVLFYPDSHHLIYDLRELQEHNPTYTIRTLRELVPNELSIKC